MAAVNLQASCSSGLASEDDANVGSQIGAAERLERPPRRQQQRNNYGSSNQDQPDAVRIPKGNFVAYTFNYRIPFPARPYLLCPMW